MNKHKYGLLFYAISVDLQVFLRLLGQYSAKILHIALESVWSGRTFMTITSAEDIYCQWYWSPVLKLKLVPQTVCCCLKIKLLQALSASCGCVWLEAPLRRQSLPKVQLQRMVVELRIRRILRALHGGGWELETWQHPCPGNRGSLHSTYWMYKAWWCLDEIWPACTFWDKGNSCAFVMTSRGLHLIECLIE